MKFRPILKVLPEILFALSSLVFWIAEGEVWNPWAIGIFLIFIQQIVWQNALLGRYLAGSISLISLFLLLALGSEFIEFERVNTPALELLLGGLLIIGSSFIASIYMLRKYGLEPIQIKA